MFGDTLQLRTDDVDELAINPFRCRVIRIARVVQSHASNRSRTEAAFLTHLLNSRDDMPPPSSLRKPGRVVARPYTGLGKRIRRWLCSKGFSKREPPTTWPAVPPVVRRTSSALRMASAWRTTFAWRTARRRNHHVPGRSGAQKPLQIGRVKLPTLRGGPESAAPRLLGKAASCAGHSRCRRGYRGWRRSPGEHLPLAFQLRRPNAEFCRCRR